MFKIRSTHLLPFAVIFTFLAVQWSATHVHLAKSHTHGLGSHQHLTEAHAHQSIDTLATAEDVAYQKNYSIAVEFSPEFRFFRKGNQKHSFYAVVDTIPHFQHSPSVTSENRSIFNTRLRDLNRSTINPRAPPYIS